MGGIPRHGIGRAARLLGTVAHRHTTAHEAKERHVVGIVSKGQRLGGVYAQMGQEGTAPRCLVDAGRQNLDHGSAARTYDGQLRKSARYLLSQGCARFLVART